MQWVRERTSIPVPKILAYGLDHSHALGAHMLLEKVRVHFLILHHCFRPRSRDDVVYLFI